MAAGGKLIMGNRENCCIGFHALLIMKTSKFGGLCMYSLLINMFSSANCLTGATVSSNKIGGRGGLATENQILS